VSSKAVRRVAVEEILPRYRSVDFTRKHDGTLVTEADLAAQRALVRELAVLKDVPVLAEEMTAHEQPRSGSARPRPAPESASGASTRSTARATSARPCLTSRSPSL
jgi:3'-phosphoadenosine 5'-phosphosulfate (PAPS) 3'-phosphatase